MLDELALMNSMLPLDNGAPPGGEAETVPEIGDEKVK